MKLGNSWLDDYLDQNIIFYWPTSNHVLEWTRLNSNCGVGVGVVFELLHSYEDLLQGQHSICLQYSSCVWYFMFVCVTNCIVFVLDLRRILHSVCAVFVICVVFVVLQFFGGRGARQTLSH